MGCWRSGPEWEEMDSNDQVISNKGWGFKSEEDCGGLGDGVEDEGKEGMFSEGLVSGWLGMEWMEFTKWSLCSLRWVNACCKIYQFQLYTNTITLLINACACNQECCCICTDMSKFMYIAIHSSFIKKLFIFVKTMLLGRHQGNCITKVTLGENLSWSLNGFSSNLPNPL